MADYEEEIAQLKLRLVESEKNAVTAATYGKLLLDENHELHDKMEETVKEYSMKIESLEQDKHLLNLRYETKVQNEQSLLNELEQLREQQESAIQSKVESATQHLEKEIQRLNRLVSNGEASLEREQAENQQINERAELLEAQLKEAQSRLDISVHDQSTDETVGALQSQIMTLVCEKQDLESQVSSLKAKVKTSNLRLSQAEKDNEMLKKEIETLECQSTSYFNALEQNKEEIMELKIEIDALKMAETDLGKKGNSLFAEVEDCRQAMEKQLQEYKSKYFVLKKQFEVKTQQIGKMKLQLANLLSLNSNKADAEYLAHLEESLVSARTQLDTLKKQCQNSEPKQSDSAVPQAQPENMVDSANNQNMTPFFKNLYTESLKKIEELNETVRSVQFEKVTLSDRILQLQRKLRQTEASKDATNSKLITLQVKYEELASKKGENVCSVPKNVKQVVEKIPGFENAIKVKAIDIKNETEENRIPLIEKQINGDVVPEECLEEKNVEASESKVAETSNSDTATNEMAIVDDQENQPIACSYEHKKKAKKSVRMTETVEIQEVNGEVQESQLKTEAKEKVAPQRKKVLRKMNAPIVHVPSGGQQNECNQQ